MKISTVLLMALASTAAQAGPININTASVEELATELHGVGPVLAARIVKVRTDKGAFQSADQMTEVLGIGPQTLQRNADFIRLH